MSQQPHLILTPTTRLARAYSHDHALAQHSAGRGAWLTPVVMSFVTWQGALRDQYLLDTDSDRAGISHSQAELLWQELIDHQVFIGEPQVASLALQSWRLLHEYRLPSPKRWDPTLLSEDSAHFAEWASAYEARCRQDRLLDEWQFAAELPALIEAGEVEAPKIIELRGFDLAMTPLQRAILAACEIQGVELRYAKPASASAPLRQLRQFSTADAELRGAARWARAELEQNPNCRLAIVVPNLQGRVAAVDRAFREQLAPTTVQLYGGGTQAWHISLGLPLSEWPLVTDALLVLQLQRQRISQPECQRLLRSPFIASVDTDANPCQQTLAWLNRQAPYWLTINELQHALKRHGGEALALQLENWQTLREAHATSAWPSQWSAQLQQELTSLEFATGRSLNSVEYQLLQRWHQLLEEFAKLDLVCGRPLTRATALTKLARQASDGVFREQNPGVAVEILGVEEALGSRFDAVWITTLDADTWPRPLRRDPLLPSALQAPIPRATSSGCLEQAQAELSALARCAAALQGSFAVGADEIQLAPSALLGTAQPLVEAPVESPQAAQMAPMLSDDRAPVFAATAVAGGTSVLRDQSACPFRAYAQRRLKAVDLSMPRPGLNPGQRGSIVHWALDAFWQDLGGSTDLQALDAAEEQQRIESAVESALRQLTRQFRLTLSRAGRRLERARVERLLQRWLALERARPDFALAAREQTLNLTFAGLEFTGRLDRLDRLTSGATLLIDYKTGNASKADWAPDDRLVDPQLPAYAVSLESTPGALAFAKLQPSALKFDGLSDQAGDTEGITELAASRYGYQHWNSWSELLSQWRSLLTELAQEFRSGHAAVDPRSATVCRHCHLQSLCRISERSALEPEVVADER